MRKCVQTFGLYCRLYQKCTNQRPAIMLTIPQVDNCDILIVLKTEQSSHSWSADTHRPVSYHYPKCPTSPHRRPEETAPE